MNYLRKNLFLIVSFIIFMILVVSAYYFFSQAKTFYTQVDNTGVEARNSSRRYEYSLKMYDTNGKSKVIKFTTSRLLREDAFLKVKYYNISGVNIWEELSFNELPSKVKRKYSS